MKIYNEEKTTLLNIEDCDLDIGCLKEDVLVVHHPAIPKIEEQGHYKVLAEYTNGGKEVEWVIDVPGVDAKEAYDEEENIQIYHIYTDNEITLQNIYKDIKSKETEIESCKNNLNRTDYIVLKYTEGLISKKDFKLTKKIREEWRLNINKLEDEIYSLNLRREALEKEN